MGPGKTRKKRSKECHQETVPCSNPKYNIFQNEQLATKTHSTISEERTLSCHILCSENNLKTLKNFLIKWKILNHGRHGTQLFFKASDSHNKFGEFYVWWALSVSDHVSSDPHWPSYKVKSSYPMALASFRLGLRPSFPTSFDPRWVGRQGCGKLL